MTSRAAPSPTVGPRAARDHRHQRQVLDDGVPARVHRHVGEARVEGHLHAAAAAGPVEQPDHRQPQLPGVLLAEHLLGVDGRVARAAAAGEVVDAEQDPAAVDAGGPGHEVRRHPGHRGERPDLGEAAGVGQPVDPLPRRQPSRGVLPGDLVRPAHPRGDLPPTVDLVDLGRPVAVVRRTGHRASSGRSRGRHHLGQGLVVPGHPGAAVVGQHQRPLDQPRVLRQHADPRIGVPLHLPQPQLTGQRLRHPGDVPRLEAERRQRRPQLGLGRRVVEVAAQAVLDARLVQLLPGDPALRARRVEPDLHGLAHGSPSAAQAWSSSAAATRRCASQISSGRPGNWVRCSSR